MFFPCLLIPTELTVFSCITWELHALFWGQSRNQRIAWHTQKVEIHNRYFVLDQKLRNSFYSLGVFPYLKIYTEINVIAYYILYRETRATWASAVKKNGRIFFSKDIRLAIWKHYLWKIKMHWAPSESHLCWKQEKDSNSLGKDPENLLDRI